MEVGRWLSCHIETIQVRVNFATDVVLDFEFGATTNVILLVSSQASGIILAIMLHL